MCSFVAVVFELWQLRLNLSYVSVWCLNCFIVIQNQMHLWAQLCQCRLAIRKWSFDSQPIDSRYWPRLCQNVRRFFLETGQQVLMMWWRLIFRFVDLSVYREHLGFMNLFGGDLAWSEAKLELTSAYAALIAAINGRMPIMLMTRLIL